MKTNNTQPTPSGTAQAEPDNNPTTKECKYRVHLFWTQTNEAFITITAKSQEEAEAKADEIESDILTDDDLNPIDGELMIDSVDLITEGQGDE